MPTFLQIPGYKVLSIEPMLGEMDLKLYLPYPSVKCSAYIRSEKLKSIDGIILGGESGPRPMHPDWPRSVRDQCAVAGVSFYFKQWNPHKVKHRLLDGREHNELPWRPK
jgi:protein gp37